MTPRYLAGDDGVLATTVGEHLTGEGWTMWPTAHATLLYLSPDGLKSAEWVKAGYPIELGGLPVAWNVTTRRRPNSALTEWAASFTEGVPPEVLIEFLTALDDPHRRDDYADSEAVLGALTRHGWLRDADYPDAASPPGLTATVSLEPEPPLIRDSDPRKPQRCWQAWADPSFDTPYLWCASFTAGTPHGLVAVFATSLTTPEPVPRHVLPSVAESHLRIVGRTVEG
ncbi:DUF317 domain-containing protein [Streptomyces sp. RFCAC02]|uniref:DUF317 domain-containing protein n=1 Tax=Streptomyces sp. RFCAC02 TaxID=2499143 RepID=UPI003207EAB8